MNRKKEIDYVLNKNAAVDYVLFVNCYFDNSGFENDLKSILGCVYDQLSSLLGNDNRHLYHQQI